MRVGLLDIQNQLGHTLELAPHADRLGFSRYWLTEFPPMPSPITIAGIVAGLTDRIRIGTAAILFNYYPPRRTAHDFQLLDRLYDGRIDAGLSSSSARPELLRDDVENRDHEALVAAYPERFATFLKHLRNTRSSPLYDAELAWAEAGDHPPEVWSLGSGRAALLAARHGTAYGYPLMYASAVDDPSIAHRYRDEFVAFAATPPRSVVAICGACGETDDAARAQVMAWGGKVFVPKVVGSPATCAEQLAALRVRYRADEVIFADLAPGLQARTSAMQMLAEAAGRIPELQ